MFGVPQRRVRLNPFEIRAGVERQCMSGVSMYTVLIPLRSGLGLNSGGEDGYATDTGVLIPLRSGLGLNPRRRASQSCTIKS